MTCQTPVHFSQCISYVVFKINKNKDFIRFSILIWELLCDPIAIS